MEYNQETFSNIYPLVKEMIKDHHDEVTIFPGAHFDIDEEFYKRLENAGLLRIYTIRDEKKSIIGYSSFTLSNHSHHKETIHAHMDTIYIHPDHRGIGLDFAKYCDEQLSYYGVHYVHRGLPMESSFGEKLIDNGYEEKEIIYIKEL